MTTACTIASHEALKTSAAWTTLRWVGLKVFEADEDEPEERYELRDCACGSTLCKRVPVRQA